MVQRSAVGELVIMSIRVAVAAISLGALGACVGVAGEDESLGTTEQAVGCPELGCNLNAASLGDGLFFHELHPLGLPNTVGVSLVLFESSRGVRLKPHVVQDQLLGIDAAGAVYAGYELLDARIHLAKGTERIIVRISRVEWVGFWVGAANQVPVYTFMYTRPSTPNRELNVCTTTETEHAVPTTAALVFTGDRYDAVHKTVSDRTNGFFNVACAGSAMAKMHLLRHTAAGQDATHTTSLKDRTAMLKMLTADVCGTGRSFTRDGEAVFYTDWRNWHPFQPGLLGKYESIWTDTGAICLDEPRREREDGPTVAHDIALECGLVLPSCAPLVGSWTTVGYGLTRNPLVLTLPFP
jgi:hypothetical protein